MLQHNIIIDMDRVDDLSSILVKTRYQDTNGEVGKSNMHLAEKLPNNVLVVLQCPY